MIGTSLNICTFLTRNFDFRDCQDCLNTAGLETFVLVNMFWSRIWCTKCAFSLKTLALIAIFKQQFQAFLVVGWPRARGGMSSLCFERATRNLSIWQAKFVLFRQVFKEKAYLVRHFLGQNMFTKTNVSSPAVFKQSWQSLKSKFLVKKVHIEGGTNHKKYLNSSFG